LTRFTHIVLAHGGGGQLTDELVAQCVLPRLGNAVLSDLLDSGIVQTQGADGRPLRLATTIDSYVVQPLVFPGGDIGRLAVSGTVNDLCVCGARPLGLALGMILAEGLERSLLEQVLDSIQQTAAEAGIKIVTGDTKVVGRGQADGMYLTTSGIGMIESDLRLHPDQVRAGDLLIINGPIADHGLAVMLAREMPQVRSVLHSDVAPLNGLIAAAMESSREIVFMRDATRGGLAAVAADLAARSGLHVVLEESSIPLRPETLHAAEMLGLDPLEVANEGKVLMVVRPQAAPAVLEALHRHPLGQQAAIIGCIEQKADGLCEIRTPIGGRRIVAKPYGEQLPRIC